MTHENSGNSNSAWREVVVKHRGQNRIAVFFEKTDELVKRFRELAGAKWSNELVAWHIPDNEENRQKFEITEKKPAKFLSQISANNQHILIQYIETIQLKGYSNSTLKNYKNEFTIFLSYLNKKSASDCNLSDVMCRDGLLRFGSKGTLYSCINLSYRKWSSNPEKWCKSIHN